MRSSHNQTGASDAALRELVLNELRCTRIRLAMAVNEIDTIGISLKLNLIDTETAIRQSQPILIEFDDRSFERDFVAHVMREESKRRQPWRSAA